MERRDFIKKMIACGGLGFAAMLAGPGVMTHARSFWESGGDGAGDYFRIVVLGDPHLPVREREVPDPDKQHKIIEAKHQVIKDINSWDDVQQIHVLGDVVAQFGNETEYAYAKDYFEWFNKPVFFIAGNHDYIYTDSLSPEGRFVRGNAESRQRKLARFKDTFGLSSLFYSQKIGKYLLLFLSTDSLDSARLAQMSEQQLKWLSSELGEYAQMPTIVFFHAPLAGTLLSYNKQVNTPDFIANPQETVENIISDNPQIILWVSGHTHTSAVNPSYAADINVFDQHVANIHNTDMDRQTIWTNSLYLYRDRIIIRTFNHRKKLWEEHLDRVVYL